MTDFSHCYECSTDVEDEKGKGPFKACYQHTDDPKELSELAESYFAEAQRVGALEDEIFGLRMEIGALKAGNRILHARLAAYEVREREDEAAKKRFEEARQKAFVTLGEVVMLLEEALAYKPSSKSIDEAVKAMVVGE